MDMRIMLIENLEKKLGKLPVKIRIMHIGMHGALIKNLGKILEKLLVKIQNLHIVMH